MVIEEQGQQTFLDLLSICATNPCVKYTLTVKEDKLAGESGAWILSNTIRSVKTPTEELTAINALGTIGHYGASIHLQGSEDNSDFNLVLLLFETCRRHRRMPDMWRELDNSHSQIATIAVPILLHSITFARDIMWRTHDRDFHPLRLVSQNGEEQDYKDSSAYLAQEKQHSSSLLIVLHPGSTV